MIKAKSIPKEFEQSFYSELFIQCSPKGYQTTKTLQDYLSNSLIPTLDTIRSVVPPDRRAVLLLMDLHRSRLDPEYLQILKNNNIHIITFPPHSSHLVQPLDRGVNAILKRKFGIYLSEENKKVCSSLPKMSPAINSVSKAGNNRIKIISALRRAISDTLTTKIIQYSFRNAGIFDDTAKEDLLHKLSRREKNNAAPERDITLEDNKQSSSSSSCTESTSPDSSFPYSSYELTSSSVIDELKNIKEQSCSTEDDDDEESNNNDTNIPQQPQTRSGRTPHPSRIWTPPLPQRRPRSHSPFQIKKKKKILKDDSESSDDSDCSDKSGSSDDSDSSEKSGSSHDCDS